MKLRSLVALYSFLAFGSLYAAELTRSVTFSSDETTAVFAVPNGFSFTRAYACDAQGESVAVEVGEPTTMNHVTLIPIALPETSQTSQTSLIVVFTDNGPLFTGRPAKVMRQAIKEKVANPEDVPTTQYVAPTRSKLKLAAAPQSLEEDAGADVLILSPHANVELWNQYATFRKSTAAGVDLKFLVKDLNEVYADYPVGSEGVRNAAESIHKYLRDNRDTLGVSYVILGGSWINAQHLNASNQWTDNDGNVIYLQTNEAMSLANCVPGIMATPRTGNVDPSDMFYACLDLSADQTYPWCDGSSTVYFEDVGNATKRAKYDAGVDIVVTRMPLKPTTINGHVYTASELMSAFIAKISRAERADFPGTGRLGNLWGQVGRTSSVDGSLPTEYEFYDDADNMFDADRPVRGYQDAEVAQRVMIKDHVAKYYPVRAVDTLNVLLWSKGHANFNEALAAYLASDRDYAGIDSHGWAGGAEALNSDNFNIATGLTLLNDVSVPCETGSQDYKGNGSGETAGRTVAIPCAGEAAVQGPTGGAIASLNNSRTGLTGPLGSNSLSYLLYHESAKAFLHQGKNAGETWLFAHLAFIGLTQVTSGVQTGGFTEGGGAHTLEEHTLFGDPLIASQVNRADGVLAASTSVSGVGAYINASSEDDLTLSGEGRLKVLQTLSIGGTSFTVEDGVEGGVGQKVVFDEAKKGVVTLKTSKRFYLGGVENATEIRVTGNNAIIDCDRLTNVDKLVFEMDSAATNVIRGIVKDALANTIIESTGGTLLFESSDILGGTSVTLEGTTVILGADPASGSLVASGEPLRGIFSGSGIIKYKHGTELMKDWTITGSVQTVDDGSDIEPGLLYSGLAGQNPTGWFTSWSGEAFNANHAVLGSKGFVSYVENGQHPHVSLAAKKGFTLSLYADLSKVDASKDVVMLSLGSSNDNQNGQLLLMSDHGKIKLVITGTNGGSAAKKYENLFAVTPGYHLYTIERVVATKSLKFYVDGVEKVNDTPTFSLGTGLQLGSQYGGLKVSREKALGMAVAGLIGFDAVLSPDEFAAHVADYPASGSPIAVAESVDLSAGNDVQAELVAATFAENTYLGANNGAMTIPANTTVSVSGVKLLNASQGGNVASLTVNGTLNVTGESTANGPYRDFANGVNAGIMLGHWGGTSTLTINEDGCVNAPNGDLLIGYTASGVVDVNGGVLTVKGLTNYSAPNNILNNNGSVLVQNGGTLEVGAWPVKSTTQLGTMPMTFNDGTLRGTADWTCPRPLTVSGPLTIDAAGHNLIFSGAISGAGTITVVDSSVGQTGSVIFVGSLQNYTGTISVASSVAKFGVRREYVGSAKISFAARPATLVVALSADQLQETCTASAYAGFVTAGSTVVFTDYDGYVYQDKSDTTVFAPWQQITYRYDNIDWSYVFLPYERGVWEPLINWRTLWSNGSETNAVQQFTTGYAPQLATSNRWSPIILNGAEFESEDDVVDGLHLVRATRLEGWNPRIGVYNGVHLYVDEFYKFQHGNESDGVTPADKWLRVDDKSRITIAKVGTGNSSGTMKFYVGGENALVFKTNVAGNTSEYYLKGNGSIKFEQGLSRGVHKIMSCEVQLSERGTKTKYNIFAKPLFDFNGLGTSVDITLADNALTLKDAEGNLLTARKFENSLAMYKDALENGVGGYTLLPGDAGLYLAYIDYAEESPTMITVSGPQTDLDLTNIPAGIQKIRLVNAWGYFKSENHTVSIPVEFMNSAAGRAAFGWNNGYSSRYVNFSEATGSGTIEFHGGTVTSEAMFFTGTSDFDGSIVFTNCNNRVYFAAPRDLSAVSCSSIVVDDGYVANLKDGGIWAAGGLTEGNIAINGTLNCKGSAQLICMPGITGVENIAIQDGYTKSLLTVTPDGNPSAARTVRVWVLPEGEIPTAEGQLGLGVTASTITLPSFDMGAHTLRVVGGTVKVGEDAYVIAPNLDVVAGSFVAAVKIGDTYYGSFAKAVEAANNGEQTITLLQNVENFNLVAGQRLVIDKNGHTISFAEGLTVEETANDDGSVSYLSTSTIYNIAYHVKDTDGLDWDVSDLRPTSFATERLPIDLPVPTASDKVFHGWYATCEDGEYSDGPQTRIERMARDNELHLYGYWLSAVATVNNVPYDNWDDAITAQRLTGFSIVALDTSRLPAGYFVNDSGYLVQIQATVLVGYPQEQTVFSSFAEARAFARGKDGAYISLSADATSPLVLDDDETVRIALNGFALEVEAADSANYNVYSSNDDAPWITTYWTTHRDVVLTLPELPEGVTATVSVNGVTVAANENGDYVVSYNATVTITYAVEGAFTLNKTSETITADGDKTADDFVAPVKTAAVAQRGNTYYPSVRSALDVAQSGETVTVLNNPESDMLPIPSGVTLDCNGCFPSGGYALTLNGGSVRGGVGNAHAVTIKSLTLTADSSLGTETNPLSGVFGIGAGANVGSTLALNGHTLHIWGQNNVFLETTTITDGNTNGGTIHVHRGNFLTHCGAIDAPKVNLVIEATARVSFEAHTTLKSFTFKGVECINGTVSATDAIVVDVPANTERTISTILAGTATVEKIGAGTITFNADNTFTGGLTVSEGTAKTTAGKKGFGPYNNGSDYAQLAWIRVAAGAVLDAGGVCGGSSDQCYQVELAGELTNSGGDHGVTSRQLSHIKVVGQNAKITGKTAALVCSGSTATRLDLGENGALEIAMDDGKIFHLRTTTLAGTGTIKITSGQLHLTTGAALANDSNIKFVIMPNATLDDGVNVIAAANISTPSDANKIVKSGCVYSVAEKAYYTVTLGEHAHAAVLGLPETSVREDAAPISFTVTPDDEFEVTVVKANETVLTAVDGVYSHKVTSDTTITVETARIITNEMTVSELNTKGMFYINADATLTVDVDITGNPSIVNEGSSPVTVTLKPSGDKRYVSAADVHKLQLGANVSLAYDWQPGKVISINFDSGRGSMTGDDIDMTFAGKVPRNSWINTTGGNGTNIAVGQLWDSDAETTQTINGMTIGYSSLGTYGPKVTATLPFMKGYLDLANYANQSVTLDLAGIPFKKCDLIVYFQTDNSNGFRPITITHNYGATTETFGYDSDKTIVKSGYSDPWGGGNQADISYRQNVMRIDGLVGSVLHIVTLPSATYRTSVAAIQIVENTEGIVTYRRNPAAASNDWMVEDGWLLPNGTPVTWRNPDLASGQIYTAEIDADQVSEIKLTSQVSASAVIVKNSATTYSEGAKSFKFLTSESLSTLLDDDPDAPILNAPVDTVGFCGDLYLQSRISGALSLGPNAHITFVAMEEGVETTAYPYTFVGTMAPIRKIGPGIFLVPESMYSAPFNVTEGVIRYDYSGADAKTVSGALTGTGKLVKTGTGELVFSSNGTISGGTTIEAGTIKLGANQALGRQGANVLVKSGAALDINGQQNHGINLTLAGGTLVNSGTGGGQLGQVHFQSMTLTADSVLDLTGRTGVLNNGWNAANLNLNGFTLTKRGTGEFLLCNTTVSSGTIRFEAGGLRSSGRDAAYVSNASNLSAADVVVAGTGITFAGFNPTVKSLSFASSGSIAASADNDATITTSSLSGTGAANKLILSEGATKDGGTVTITGALTLPSTMTIADTSVDATLFTLGDGVEVATLPTLTNEGYALKKEGQAIKFVIADGYAPVYATDGTTIESVRGVGKIYVSSTASSQAWGNEVTFETAEGKRTTFIKGNTPETTDTVVVLKTTQFWVKDDKVGTTLEIGDADHTVTVAFAQSGENASYTVNGLHLKIAAGSQVDIDNVSRASDSSWSKNATPEVHDATIEGEGTVCIPSTMSATFSGTTTVSAAIKLEGSLTVNNTASIDESKLYTSEGTRKYIKKTVVTDGVKYEVATIPTATKSLNFNNSATTASAKLGGSALAGGNDSSAGQYLSIRGEDGNMAATINSFWSNNNFVDPSATAWSVLTVAKCSGTNNGMLWTCGKSVNAPQTGFALVEQSGNTIALIAWNNNVTDKLTTICSYTANDDSFTRTFHSFLVTRDSDGFKLYVDGEQKSVSSGNDYSNSVIGYQLAAVHGNGGLGLAKDPNAFFDELGVWSGTALSADEAKALADLYPVWPRFVDDDADIPFGTKVIGLKSNDSCAWTSSAEGQMMTSHVGQKYDQVVVTVLIDLPVTSTAMKIVSVNEASSGGTSDSTAELWWNGRKLYFGHSGNQMPDTTGGSYGNINSGLHVISCKVTTGGVYLYIDDETSEKASNTVIKWTGKSPTGTFIYQGDIKSITLDFSAASDAVSGLDALPKFTQKGAAVTDLATISEILEMTGKSIGDVVFADDEVPADVTMGSFVETGAADTIGITVGTSLDLPNGEVTVLVDDGAGSYLPLANSPTLKSPTKNDSRMIELPINSILDGAKSRLFKLKVSPKN